MENASYTTLTRQTGLLREMTTIANNIANMSTNGFRREGLVFSEFVRDLGPEEASLSMANGNTRNVSLLQGTLTQTGGRFDFAIEGDGFFLIATPDGDALTRAGSFTSSAEGDLVTFDGYPVLDAGGAPIFVPPDAKNIGLAADGTLSADGRPLAQLGLWRPVETGDLARQQGVRFTAPGGIEPVEDPTIVQGFVEGSNVDPVAEIARMIEVQRAYEMGQGFLEKEDERIRTVIQTLGR